jgi:hypothetical protein
VLSEELLFSEQSLAWCMLGTGLLDHALKLNMWNQLEDLAEHAA